MESRQADNDTMGVVRGDLQRKKLGRTRGGAMTQTQQVIALMLSKRFITVREVEVDLGINSGTSAIRGAIAELQRQGIRVGRDWGENLLTGKRFKTYGVVKCEK